jgi:hypothetical protein
VDDAERALELADLRLYEDKSRHESGEAVRRAMARALRERPPGDAELAALAGRVARALGLSGESLELVVRAAELHDVGTDAVPEAILCDPDGLDEEGRALLRQHTVVGERMLSAVQPLCQVARLVRACDERWDGSGYPDGLSGEQIPLGARIVAGCRGFHELSAGRGLSPRAALAEVREEAGRGLDPAVVRALEETLSPKPARRAPARAGLLMLIALGTALLAPSAALAGTVSLSKGKLTVTADPGRANQFEIWSGTSPEGSGVLVKDASGAPMTPRSGCVYWGGGIGCAMPASVTVDAGDGNDRVVVHSPLPFMLMGGAGDDRLSGGEGVDVLEGGYGEDTLAGGPGADVFRGQGGTDTVTFADHAAGVDADADGAADDGAAGERDTVMSDVENLVGSPGADLLVGAAGPNALNGGDGDDTLYGRDGDDVLDGGEGSDAVRAEAGDDTVLSNDGSVDDVSCGAGSDSATADPADRLDADCENRKMTPPPAPAAALLPGSGTLTMSSSGTVPVQIRCPATTVAGCRGTLTIELAEGARAAVKRQGGKRRRGVRRADRDVLGRSRFYVPAGRTSTVRVRMSRNGRRRVLRRRRLRCRASAAIRSGGRVTTARRTVTLRAPGRTR